MQSPLPSEIDLVSDITIESGSESRPPSTLGHSSIMLEPPQTSLTLADYYMPDGDLYLQVDYSLFLVHKHFIYTYSPYFRDHLQHSTAESNGDGVSKDTPFRVDPELEVSASDFAELLWVLYDETLERNASGEKWMNILFTAKKFGMDQVVRLAVENLKRLSFEYDAVTKISVQQDYSLPVEWAKKEYIDICMRSKPLTKEESKRVGLDATIMIARTQGSVMSKSQSSGRDIAEQAVADFASESAGAVKPSTPIAVLSESEPYSCEVEGSNVVIEVDNEVTFRAHRSLLEKQLPSLNAALTASDDGVTHVTFANMNALHVSWLLWVLYDRGLTYNASPAQWEAILFAADRLKMSKICALAVKHIRETKDVIDQIIYIEEYNIQSEWTEEVWNDLGNRSGPLSRDEWRRLGMSKLSTVAKVFAIREECVWRRIEGFHESKSVVDEAVTPKHPSRGGKLAKRRWDQGWDAGVFPPSGYT